MVSCVLNIQIMQYLDMDWGSLPPWLLSFHSLEEVSEMGSITAVPPCEVSLCCPLISVLLPSTSGDPSLNSFSLPPDVTLLLSSIDAFLRAGDGDEEGRRGDTLRPCVPAKRSWSTFGVPSPSAEGISCPSPTSLPASRVVLLSEGETSESRGLVLESGWGIGFKSSATSALFMSTPTQALKGCVGPWSLEPYCSRSCCKVRCRDFTACCSLSRNIYCPWLTWALRCFWTCTSTCTSTSLDEDEESRERDEEESLNRPSRDCGLWRPLLGVLLGHASVV